MVLNAIFLKGLILIYWMLIGVVPNISDLNIAADKKIRKAIIKTFITEDFVLEELVLGKEIMAITGSINTEHIYAIRQSGSTLGFLYLSSAKGRYDYFDFLVLYDTKLIIKTVEILVYREDHGYEVSNRSWLAQFQGSSGCDTNYGKEIDALSGATYSAVHLTEEIGRMCWVMHLVAR